MAAWHEDDRFWKTYAPYMFGAERWQHTPDEVDRLLALLNVPAGAAVLDLCCGPGRHTLELARRGYAVIGVDRTAAYIAEARRRARRDKLAATFIEDDMRRFVRPNTFDAAINMFTAFGYFEKPADDRRVVQNLYRSLRPGGVLVMEMMGKEVLAKRFRERDWHDENGVLFLEERKLSDNWSWIESRWMLIDGTRRKEWTVAHRLYSAHELIALLEGVGFGYVEAFGNLAGVPYDHDARRLVVRAVKGRRRRPRAV